MSFNAEDHNTDNRFEPFPEGRYKLALTKAVRKESKTAGNFYMNCQINVVNGEFKGRTIFMILNLQNSNSTAQEIAEADLARIMKACRVRNLSDKWNLEPLMGIPFEAEVVITESTGYDPKNEVKKIYFEEFDSKASGGGSKGGDPWDQPEEGGKKKKKKKKDKKKG